MASCRYIYAFLHGALSGALSRKGVALEKHFGQHGQQLVRPILHHEDTRSLTVTEAMPFLRSWFAERQRDHHAQRQRQAGPGTRTGAEDACLRDAVAPSPSVKLRLIGACHGGYLATRYAELHPEQVDGLLLLSPMMSIRHNFQKHVGGEQWEKFLPEGWSRESGAHVLQYRNAMLADTAQQPDHPLVRCRTHILHAQRDALVPAQCSLDYVDVLRQHCQDKHVGDSMGCHGDGREAAMFTVEVVNDNHYLLAQASTAKIHSAIHTLWQIPDM